MLAHGTAIVIMPLVNLTWSRQYVFAAVVSKDNREDVMVQQVVNVLSGEPPHLDIRYL